MTIKPHHIAINLMMLMISSHISASPANIKEDRPSHDNRMDFSIYTPCTGSSSDCGPIILAQGRITNETPNDFLLFIKKNKEKIGSKICFDSSGGDIPSAIKLGEIINDNEFDTCMLDTYEEERFRKNVEQGTYFQLITKNPKCIAACIYALAGGSFREIGDDSKIGIQKITTENTNATEIQDLYATLSAYLKKQKINRDLLEISASTNTAEIRWLTNQETKTLRLDNSAPLETDWTLEALNNGTISATKLISISKKKIDTFIGISKLDKNTYLLIVIAYFTNPNFRKSYFIEATDRSKYTFITIDSKTHELPAPLWKIKNNQATMSLLISDQLAKRIAAAKKISVTFNIANAYYYVDPSFEISNTKNANAIRAVINQ